MDKRTSEQPHMVWVGPLPPHLQRREPAAAEEAPDPPLEWEDGPPRLRLPAPPSLASIIGFAVALVVGVAIGSLIPRLLHQAPHVVAAPPASTRMAASAAPPQLRISPPAPEPETAVSEPPAAPAPAGPPPRPGKSSRGVVVASASPGAHGAAHREESKGGPCRLGDSRADYDVCAQPMLSDADRDLKRAYQHALSSGVSPQALQADQGAWTRERELAARRGPIDLVAAYSAQIARVESMSSEAPH
jgi:uncharacterized protein YecT (DUF1311 family)